MTDTEAAPVFATDISSARVIHPTGRLNGVSVYFYRGSAAAWKINRRDRHHATRLLYKVGGTFIRRSTAREPHVIAFDDGTEWRIIPSGAGGCNCGGSNPLSNFTIEQLTSPELGEV